MGVSRPPALSLFHLKPETLHLDNRYVYLNSTAAAGTFILYPIRIAILRWDTVLSLFRNSARRST